MGRDLYRRRSQSRRLPFTAFCRFHRGLLRGKRFSPTPYVTWPRHSRERGTGTCHKSNLFGSDLPILPWKTENSLPNEPDHPEKLKTGSGNMDRAQRRREKTRGRKHDTAPSLVCLASVLPSQLTAQKRAVRILRDHVGLEQILSTRGHGMHRGRPAYLQRPHSVVGGGGGGRFEVLENTCPLPLLLLAPRHQSRSQREGHLQHRIPRMPRADLASENTILSVRSGGRDERIRRFPLDRLSATEWPGRGTDVRVSALPSCRPAERPASTRHDKTGTLRIK